MYFLKADLELLGFYSAAEAAPSPDAKKDLEDFVDPGLFQQNMLQQLHLGACR